MRTRCLNRIQKCGEGNKGHWRQRAQRVSVEKHEADRSANEENEPEEERTKPYRLRSFRGFGGL